MYDSRFSSLLQKKHYKGPIVTVSNKIVVCLQRNNGEQSSSPG